MKDGDFFGIISPSSFNSLSVKNKSIQFELALSKHEAKRIEMEISPSILLDTSIDGEKADVNKIILKTDSQTEKLKNFADTLNYNLNNGGKKKFTIIIGRGKVVEQGGGKLPYEITRSRIAFYGELELKLEDFPNLTLQGTLTKPTNPPSNPPPTPPPGDGPNGPNGPNQNISQLREKAITDIQAELDKNPPVVDSELGHAIETARAKKESSTIEQAINNLTDKSEKARAKEL
nr:7934_t:CDS:2 [Entrophospora candida]